MEAFVRFRSWSGASLAFLIAGLKLTACSLTCVYLVGFVTFLLCAAPARAQSLTFTTLAGTAGSRGSADGIGSAAQFYSPSGVAVDGSGNVYVADSGNHTIRKGVTAVLSGDANGDGSVTVGDVFYLINYLFAAGPAPISGDVNSDGSVTVGDVFYLVNYLFAGGPAPH
jgi:NHL repeat